MLDEQKEPLQLSRSEIESVCTTAARGAGMSWGLAEEAGFAAGWMATRGLNGAELLAKHLHRAQQYCWQDLSPVVDRGEWRASTVDQALCPIASGVTLNDYLSVDHSLFDGDGLHVLQISFPGLVLPFIALIATELNTFIHVQAQCGVVCMSYDGSLSGAVSALLAVEQEALVIVTANGPIESTAPLKGIKPDLAFEAAGDVPVGVELLPTAFSPWSFLYGLSMRTTVPATEASRGNAGATGSDND